MALGEWQGSTTIAAVRLTKGAAIFARLGFIHQQRPTLVICPIERLNGLLSFGLIAHLDESKTARPAGLLVRDHLGADYRPVLLKEGQQVVGTTIPNEIADVNVLPH